jgi:two-component system, chemotaxis family, chemotaxis protein CheY
VTSRILIVDDNPAVRRAMRRIIEQTSDFEVCGEAEDGNTAVERFRELRPDAVVLDFSMPVKNGLEAAREITLLSPTTPLLMCTMFKSEQLVREAREVGIKQVVSKGEKLGSNLTMTIRALLRRAA